MSCDSSNGEGKRLVSHWAHGRIVMNQWSLRTTGVYECLSSSGWPRGKKKINVKNDSLRVGGCSINRSCWLSAGLCLYQCVFEYCLGGRTCLRG